MPPQKYAEFGGVAGRVDDEDTRKWGLQQNEQKLIGLGKILHPYWAYVRVTLLDSGLEDTWQAPQVLFGFISRTCPRKLFISGATYARFWGTEAAQRRGRDADGPRPTVSALGETTLSHSACARPSACEIQKLPEVSTVKEGRTTLRGTNISHLGKRKIVFKKCLGRGYVSSHEGSTNHLSYLSSILKP